MLSPGPAQEPVDLIVYPKDRYGNYLQPFDVSKLLLGIQQVDKTWSDSAPTWSAIPSGFQILQVPRYSVSGLSTIAIRVVYSGVSPSLESDFSYQIQGQPSVFSFANSDIEFPATISCLSQGSVILTPKDQYDQPRYGPGAAPTLPVTFVNTSSGPPPLYDSATGFLIRNDGLLLPFSLTAQGSYELVIEDPSDPKSVARKCEIAAINSISADHCVPYGEGLCSGIGGTQVQFYMKLKDQDGNPYSPSQNENLNLSIILNIPGGNVPDISIPYAIKADLLTASYTRPALGSYQIQLNVNNMFAGGGPFRLTSTTTAVSSSVTKSVFSVWSVQQQHHQPEVIALFDQIQGLITTYDGQGGRWYQPLENDTYSVTWPAGCTPGVLTDNGDGTYTMNATFTSWVPNPSPTVSVSSTTNPQQSCVGSPMTLPLNAVRQFTTVNAYGSGLEQGQNEAATINIRGFDQYGKAFSPNINIDCILSVFLNGAVFPSTIVDRETLSTQMPVSPSSSIMVLLAPIKAADKGGVAFRPQLFFVPIGPPVTTDPTKCFLIWNRLVSDDVSVATLYAIDGSGNRRRQGGDLVRTNSPANTPTILTTSIVDNLDGSYTITMMMPAAAFTTSTPAPQLQITVNHTPIFGSPITFPLTPLPLASVSLEGAGLSDTIIGSDAAFSINCLDSKGQLTSSGFYSVSVYLLQTGVDIPQYVSCFVGPNSGGVIGVGYNVPLELGPGLYQCYISINSEPIDQSPININIKGPLTIDDFDQACELTHYQLTAPIQDWTVQADWSLWKIDTSQADITTLTTQSGTAVGATNPVSFALNLPTTDAWFGDSGFMFSFDIAIDSRDSIKVSPFQQPTNALTMTWSPGPTNDSGDVDTSKSTCAWTVDTSSGVQAVAVAHPERKHIESDKAGTIAFLYMISKDKSVYTLYIFQSGGLVTSGTWPYAAGFPPTLGLVLQRTSTIGCKITISNIMTIPTHFRTNKLENPASGEDLIFSEPWARQYVSMYNYPGSLDSKGLTIDGTHWNQSSNPTIAQEPVSQYGASVAVYSLTIPKVYNWSSAFPNPPPQPIIANINFQGPSFAPSYGQWVDWNGRIQGIGPSNLVVSPTTTNTVMVITGQGCVTIISNGEFQFYADQAFGINIVGLTPPELFSWWTDIVWHAIRVSPPLRTNPSTPAQPTPSTAVSTASGVKVRESTNGGKTENAAKKPPTEIDATGAVVARKGSAPSTRFQNSAQRAASTVAFPLRIPAKIHPTKAELAEHVSH